MASFRLGIIGDLHTHWDDVDIAQFNGSGYDLLFFTGDLGGGGSPGSTLRIARALSRLEKPTLVMPGNNDVVDIAEFEAELTHRSGLARLADMRAGVDGVEQQPPAVRLCGYGVHRFPDDAVGLTMVSARPHSMGGPELSFPDHMVSTYGISTMEQSTKRLLELVEDVATPDVIFLAHNGPVGLGADPLDPWGCDFRPGGGDWGDPDLQAAIDYARERGKRVLAVIAGHMHLRTKSGAERRWRAEADGTMYLNAARVPRIFSREDDVHRHHLALRIDGGVIAVEEVHVPQYAD